MYGAGGEAEVHVRVCRDCGEEYRPEIARCADCGGVLEDRYEDDFGLERDPSPLPPSPEPARPPSDYRPVFWSHQAADLLPLANRLAEAGVAFHLHGAASGAGHAMDYGLFVPEAERERALAALGGLIAGEAGAEALAAVERDFDPERGYRRCPACSSDLTAGAAECPECGLAVGGEAEPGACPRCAARIAPGSASCKTCGFAASGDT